MSVYEEVIHWKLNTFLIPFGKSGNSFVQELARLYWAFAEDSALHSIALMLSDAAFVIAETFLAQLC